MSNDSVQAPQLDEIWFDSDGVKLFAAQRGSGFPIILLHGGLASHLACWRFAAPLAARFRVILPDVRASGRSIYAGELSWDQLADDVAALMRHLGLERAVVGGISFGAGCAVRFALRHPALLAGLVVLTPAFAGAELGLNAAQMAAMQAMEVAGRRVVSEGIQALEPLFDALPEAMRSRARAMAAGFDPASVAASTRFMNSGAQPFATGGELAAISAPSLLVPGTDPTHPAEASEVFRRHLGRCVVREVEPADLSAAIADFVDRELA